MLPTDHPAGAFDSTVAILGLIGVRVAEVRSGVHAYRVAVFNETDGAVVVKADMLRQRCQALRTVTLMAVRGLCRSCTAPQMRGPIERYRAEMPRVASVGRRCSATLAGLSRGSQATAATALRREVRTIGSQITRGLEAYELRLGEVRRTFGGAPAAPTRPAPPRRRSP